MIDFSIRGFQVGPIMTNCFFLINNDSKKLIVIDPGASAKALYEEIKKLDCVCEAILLTHGHFDHADGVDELKALTGAKVYAHEDEKKVLNDPSYNLSDDFVATGSKYDADVFVNDAEHLKLSGFDIAVIHTPGHTPGGICFYIEEEKILFSGDSLFNQSIGRTDFLEGSASQLIRSIKEKLLCLPDDVNVYPGHGAATSIGYEKKYNPFFD